MTNIQRIVSTVNKCRRTPYMKDEERDMLELDFRHTLDQ